VKKILALAATLAILAPATGWAQDTTTSNLPDNAARAPDGTRAFGIEPYVGILGGYHSFDRNSEFGSSPTRGRFDGALVSGIAGVNIPVGPVFAGVEGNATKGFGDIDWEYGVKGRVGARAGESGMVFASMGYQWVNGRRSFGDRDDWIYGLGVEVGPKEIGLGGITGNSGVRLRLEVQTFDFNSIRPMGGAVFHF
jgi:hypothetical protein